MAEKTRDELKSYFQSGKRPTGQQFADLIDSVLNKLEDGVGTDGNNNLGIGIVTPDARLHVFNTQSNGLLIENYDWPELDMIADSENNDHRSKITLDPVSGALQFRLGQGATGVDEAGDSKLIIDQNGNLGIGTNNPGAKLELAGIADHAAIILNNNNLIGFKRNDGALVYGIGHTDGEFTIGKSANLASTAGTPMNIATGGTHIRFVQGTEERMRIHTGGNVGIGTATPGAKLEVAGTADNAAIILNNNNLIGFKRSDGALVYGIGHTDGEFTVGKSTHLAPTAGTPMNIATGGAYIRFVQGTEESMRIHNGGNVGIDTSNPQAKLHINNGNVLVSSQNSTTLTVSGSNSGYINAGIVLKSNHSTNYRGSGMFLYDMNGGNEWFAGRPYAGSDQFVIYRNSGLGDHTNASAGLHDGGGGATGTQAMLVVKNNGNTGIGITNPGAKLEVADTADHAAIILRNNNLIGFKRGDGALVYGIGHTEGEFIVGKSANLGPLAGTPMRIATGGSHIRFVQDTEERMRISPNGNVGIGTTNPAYKLDVNGIIQGNNVAASDRRLKKQIKNISKNAVIQLRELRGVSYQYKKKAGEDKAPDKRKNFGFIAQEVREVFPDLVYEDHEGMLSLSYTGLIPVLTEAVKDMDNSIKKRDKTIEEQNKAIKELKATNRKRDKTIEEQNKAIKELKQDNKKLHAIIKAYDRRFEKLEVQLGNDDKSSRQKLKAKS